LSLWIPEQTTSASKAFKTRVCPLARYLQQARASEAKLLTVAEGVKEMMRLMRRRSQKGFTLIELLIVVAIIGIIAAILIPNLLDALQKAKQKRTVGDMRDVGAAWFSWLTDQVGAAAAGQGTKQYTLPTAVTMTGDQLLSTLYPADADIFYIQEVPNKDGWANPYEYRYSDNPLTAQVMAIRSPGRDNVIEGAAYTMGPFLASDYDQDIVWADGFFVKYPAGAKVD
jgi:general secretion pathway protein G